MIVDGVSVEWRVLDGVIHASTLSGLARGLAHAAANGSGATSLLSYSPTRQLRPCCTTRRDLDDV